MICYETIWYAMLDYGVLLYTVLIMFYYGIL